MTRGVHICYNYSPYTRRHLWAATGDSLWGQQLLFGSRCGVQYSCYPGRAGSSPIGEETIWDMCMHSIDSTGNAK